VASDGSTWKLKVAAAADNSDGHSPRKRPRDQQTSSQRRRRPQPVSEADHRYRPLPLLGALEAAWPAPDGLRSAACDVLTLLRALAWTLSTWVAAPTDRRRCSRLAGRATQLLAAVAAAALRTRPSGRSARRRSSRRSSARAQASRAACCWWRALTSGGGRGPRRHDACAAGRQLEVGRRIRPGGPVAGPRGVESCLPRLGPNTPPTCDVTFHTTYRQHCVLRRGWCVLDNLMRV
jgi:hypothetical protein